MRPHLVSEVNEAVSIQYVLIPNENPFLTANRWVCYTLYSQPNLIQTLGPASHVQAHHYSFSHHFLQERKDIEMPIFLIWQMALTQYIDAPLETLSAQYLMAGISTLQPRFSKFLLDIPLQVSYEHITDNSHPLLSSVLKI